MQHNQSPQWEAIQNFSFDVPNLIQSFPERLAAKGRWTKDFTNQVILEYKKFLFLSTTTNLILVPSLKVDLAWRTHMDYHLTTYNEFCETILGRKPERCEPSSEDGTGWLSKYYAHTLFQYQTVFNETPNAAIWPASSEWFQAGFNLPFRINHKNIRIKFSWVTSAAFFAFFAINFFKPSPLLFIVMFIPLAITIFIQARFLGPTAYLSGQMTA